MAKVRVADQAKEIKQNADLLIESISQSRKRTFEVLKRLKKLTEDLDRAERERLEQEKREQLSQKYREAASYMTAYSTEQVPEAVEEQPEPVQAEIPAAEPQSVPGPVIEEKPVQDQPVQTVAPTQPQRRPLPTDRPPRPREPRPSYQGDRPAYQGDRPQQGQFQRRDQQGAYPRQGQGFRPQQGGAQRPFQPGRDRPQGTAPYQRPQQGQFQRPQGQMGARPQQGGQPMRPGQRPGGFQRNRAPELTPTIEKERVSNYDPNKKQYIRQNDPERSNQKNRRQLSNMNRSSNYGMDDDFVRGKKKKKQAVQVKPEPVVIDKAFMTAEKITVKDLSERIGKPVGEIIKKLLLLGIMATINNELDYDTAQLVCSEFGVELELKLAQTAEDALEDENFEDKEEDLVGRAPVVTIMGHVDHGKTSLLDYIRSSHITQGEAGGITQHIGAYTVEIDGRKITFLDTPGHEAFTAMRLRGAQATDIAVLVVAADDGVMPQTIEAINHAKAANVPVVVAINKMDKQQANPDRVKQELTEYGLVSEDWGGDTIMVPVSALTGDNVDLLLENILLLADMQNLRANPNRKARGIIIEARLDKGRGPVATVLIKNGTLNIGDAIIAGTSYGRVRAMVNDRGERVTEAGPSEPVEVIGFNDVPEAGDVMSAVDDDRLSRQVAEERKDKLREALVKNKSQTTLDDLFSQISAGEIKDLNLIIKADVQGSVEAVKQSLEKLSNDEVRVRSIHGAPGAITESDILLASASNAIIIGFNVRTDNAIRDAAAKAGVDIRLYRVIYDAIEDVTAAMKGMLAPKFRENVLGSAEVRQTFRISGVGTIAGCYVTEGKVQRNAKVRLVRDSIVIYEGTLDSLKRHKDDAKEVAQGYECGIGLANYNDVKEGDRIECFIMEEIQQ